MTAGNAVAKLTLMSGQISYDKLKLLHEVSDLVEENGLWIEIARLGMTREFIDKNTNLYARIIMELDFIEKYAPKAQMNTRKLKAIAARLSVEDVSERQK